MSGSIRLTEAQQREMRDDALDPGRRNAFAAARRLSQRGSLDDYIDFLSDNMEWAGPHVPRRHVTDDYRL